MCHISLIKWVTFVRIMQKRIPLEIKNKKKQKKNRFFEKWEDLKNRDCTVAEELYSLLWRCHWWKRISSWRILFKIEVFKHKQCLIFQQLMNACKICWIKIYIIYIMKMHLCFFVRKYDQKFFKEKLHHIVVHPVLSFLQSGIKEQLKFKTGVNSIKNWTY